jgi:hypothetical protein
MRKFAERSSTASRVPAAKVSVPVGQQVGSVGVDWAKDREVLGDPMTLQLFPGVESLSTDVQVALLSLVLTGECRSVVIPTGAKRKRWTEDGRSGAYRMTLSGAMCLPFTSISGR